MTDLTQRARDVAGRLHFELRDWKPGDRFHFPSINARTLDEAAAIISELVERIEGVWQDIETAPRDAQNPRYEPGPTGDYGADGIPREGMAATYAPPGLQYASVDQNEQWLLRFADQDCGDQWFGGDGYTPEEARELAIDAWNRYAPAWSVRLMRTVTLDEVRAVGAVIQQAFAERVNGHDPIETHPLYSLDALKEAVKP